MNTPIYDALLAGVPSPADGATPLPASTAWAAPGAAHTLARRLLGAAGLIYHPKDGANRALSDEQRLSIATLLGESSAMLDALTSSERAWPTGIAMIAAERAHQIEARNHDLEGDLGRSVELMSAAESYLRVAAMGADSSVNPDGSFAPPGGWPWSDEAWHPDDDPLQDLATSGALIAAAIDSLATGQYSRRSRAQRRDEHVWRRITH